MWRDCPEQLELAREIVPGAIRIGSWLSSAFAGSYNDAVALAALTPGLTANDTIAQTRQGRTKYGFYVNMEQEIGDSVGAFTRFSWNDGRTEIMSFTDIDSSLSAGLASPARALPVAR